MDVKTKIESAVTNFTLRNINSGVLAGAGMITFCDLITVKFAIFKKDDKTWVSWPVERDKEGNIMKDKSGKFTQEGAFPKGKEEREALNTFILTKFNTQQENTTPATTTSTKPRW